MSEKPLDAPAEAAVPEPVSDTISDGAEPLTPAEAAYERGNDHYAAEQLEEARLAFEEAARLLRHDEEPLAKNLYENLGVVLWRLGRWNAASRNFLRALDGDLGSREQALRLLVGCLFREGRGLDGERMLGTYEALFGEHPEGWSRDDN